MDQWHHYRDEYGYNGVDKYGVSGDVGGASAEFFGEHGSCGAYGADEAYHGAFEDDSDSGVREHHDYDAESDKEG